MISEGINKETVDTLRESSDQELHNINAASSVFVAAYVFCLWAFDEKLIV